MSAVSAMKWTPQKTTYGAPLAAAVLRQLEAVAARVGELDDLVALVVVAEDEDLVASAARAARARSTSAGSGRGTCPGQIVPRSASGSGAAEQQQRRRRGGVLEVGRGGLGHGWPASWKGGARLVWNRHLLCGTG
jgi:hypothetical protein